MSHHPPGGDDPLMPPSATPPLNLYHNGRIRRPGFNRKTAKLLSALLIATGLFLVVFQITVILIGIHDYFVGLAGGIWGGIMAVIAGSFGLASAQRQTNCLIIAYMVLSILTSIFCAIPVKYSVVGLALSYRQHYNPYLHGDGGTTLQTVTAIFSMVLIIALLIIVLSIWSSAVCCKAVCCGLGNGYDTSYQVQYVAAAQGVPQQVVIMTPPPPVGGLTYALPPPAQPAYSIPQVTIPLHNMNAAVQSPVHGVSSQATPMVAAPCSSEAPPAYCTMPWQEKRNHPE